MPQFLALFPLFILMATFAGFLKFTAFIFRRTRLSWKHTLVFTGMYLVLAYANAFRLKWYGAFLSPLIETPILAVIVVVMGGAFFRGRARSVDGVPFSYKRGAALTGLHVGLGLTFITVIFLLMPIIVPATHAAPSAGPSDLSVEVVGLSPANGSTLLAHEQVDVLLKYRYSKPAEPIRIWVKILDPKLEGTYIGIAEPLVPGEDTIIRSAFLTAPGKVKTLTIVAKDAASMEIFRKDIVVDFTFKANPAVEAREGEGAGSKITSVSFPEGKRVIYKKGTFVPVVLGYQLAKGHGMYTQVIPVTDCSMTHGALLEPLLGNGEVRMGFTIGERCHVKRVEVIIMNDVNKRVFEGYIDVDLQYVD
jgi:hypothetical protein